MMGKEATSGEPLFRGKDDETLTFHDGALYAAANWGTEEAVISVEDAESLAHALLGWVFKKRFL